MAATKPSQAKASHLDKVVGIRLTRPDGVVEHRQGRAFRTGDV
jgi:hypothetical protein